MKKIILITVLLCLSSLNAFASELLWDAVAIVPAVLDKDGGLVACPSQKQTLTMTQGSYTCVIKDYPEDKISDAIPMTAQQVADIYINHNGQPVKAVGVLPSPLMPRPFALTKPTDIFSFSAYVMVLYKFK